MKNHYAIILSVLASVPFCFAVEPAGFQMRAGIEIMDLSGDFHSVTLTNEVYDNSTPELSDVRIFDLANIQVPYYLKKTRTRPVITVLDPELINRAITPQGGSAVTLDFGRSVEKNSITVRTSGSDFRRKVTVLGSNDNKEFYTIVPEAYIFSVDDGIKVNDGFMVNDTQKADFQRIETGVNDFRYLKVIVYPMSAQDQPVEILDVASAHRVRPVYKTRTLAARLVSVSDDPKTGETICLFDLGFRNLPVNSITLAVEDTFFYRRLTVAGRNSETQKVLLNSEDNVTRYREVPSPWRHITSSVIYSYPRDQQRGQSLDLSIGLDEPGLFPRYIRIIIHNYDDRPVTVTGADFQVVPDRIIFTYDFDAPGTLPENQLFLYTSNPSLHRPEYPSARALADARINPAAAKLTPMSANPLYQEPQKTVSWTEKQRFLLSGILLLAVIIMTGIIIYSFRAMRMQNDKLGRG